MYVAIPPCMVNTPESVRALTRIAIEMCRKVVEETTSLTDCLGRALAGSQFSSEFLIQDAARKTGHKDPMDQVTASTNAMSASTYTDAALAAMIQVLREHGTLSDDLWPAVHQKLRDNVTATYEGFCEQIDEYVEMGGELDGTDPINLNDEVDNAKETTDQILSLYSKNSQTKH